MFPKTPSLTLYDPLGDLLSAGDGHFTYTFDDAVKLSGHACPTVAGAFLMVIKAVEYLFGDETPQRGGIAIRVHGAREEQVNGPITQVFTLLTGAASENGFHGLAGQFNRYNLLRFQEKGIPRGSFQFERISTGQKVSLTYSANVFPPSPVVGEILPNILGGHASDDERATFRQAWKQRVLDILEDGGVHTVRHV